MEEDWNDTFYDLFREAVGRYHEGHRNVDGFFTDQEIMFLSSIGCRTRELFDFVESYARTGAPSPTTVLLIAAARRNFFHLKNPIPEKEKSGNTCLRYSSSTGFAEEFRAHWRT